MSLALIYWREAAWLWLIFLPLLAWYIARYRQVKKLDEVIAPNMRDWALAPQSKKKHHQPILLTLGWILLCVAMAGPRTPIWTPPIPTVEQTNIMLLIDLSASMQAQDVIPSRRTAALQSIRSWLEKTPSNISIGIQLFAGNSHTVAAPTSDHASLAYLIEQVEILQLPTLGNDLASAINDANKLFKTKSEKRLLLFSDGDLGDRAQTLATQAAKNSDIPLYIVGIGGDEASTISDNKGGQLRLNGRSILSRQQGAWLRNLANNNQGNYLSLQSFNRQEAKQALNLKTSAIPKEQQQNTLWQEHFPIPLLGALAIFLFSLHVERQLLNKLLLVLILFPIWTEKNAFADDPQEITASAYSQLINSNFPQAQKLYATTQGYDARFGEGIACYRQKQFDCAIRNFSQAVWLTEDKSKRAQAVFNLANAHFRNTEFAQASVLFADARALGIAEDISQLGQDYSDSALEAIRRYRRDLADSLRRAEWRAAASPTQQDIGEQLAQGRNLNLSLMTDASANLPLALQKELLQRALDEHNHNNQGVATSSRWIETSELKTGSTSQLLHKLLELESGIPAHQNAPRAQPGIRQW